MLPYYLMASAHALSVAFWWTDTCYATWALLSVALIGVPAQVRTFEGISSLSALSVASVAIALLVIGVEWYEAARKKQTPRGRNPSPPRSGTASTPSRQQHLHTKGQSMLLEIAHEMENAPRDFGKAITASCGGLLALCSMATGLGYYYRGARVAGFLPDDLGGQRVQDAGGSDALLPRRRHVPREQPAFIKKLYELRWGALDKSRVVALRWFCITMVLLAWSFVVANAIPWFSAFQALMGSLLGAPIMFLFPVAFYVLDPRQADNVKHLPTRFALATTGGIILPLTLGVGSVAAFVGLSEAWGDGAAFACVPGGYDG